ncbi:DNA-binding GntR family transcriptional regulator [Neobacillus niacini]|uniref:GntR family transcriptional regulator n=1 Tax=Neobacillus niacini TaxID=86668 RepID=UPI002863DD98|nr:GntR family transcriptional regulator [Neobacillus niacini]MDR7076160.1 DNA-binding GntR family transcriptional regulator [Neobacillus niacini]
MKKNWTRLKRPQSLRDQVIDQIVYAIAYGNMKPGQRIVEADLAQTLGVSRGPVREALSTLTQEGLVKIVPYKGTYVTELNRKEIWEVCTLRATLEEFSVRRIVESTENETINKLWSHYDEMVEMANSGGAINMAEIDMNLHEQIVLAADHELLYRAWTPLKYRVLLYSTLTIEKRYPRHSTFDSLVKMHAELIRTIEEGDADKAATKIKNHIIQPVKELLRHKEDVEYN